MAKKKQSSPPANRRGTGGKLKNGLDPSIGKATQFPPNVSGNPAGRPPDLLSDAYRKVLAKIVEQDPSKRNIAELVAEGVARAAIKGNVGAAKEMADRTEGTAKDSIEISGKNGAPLEFNLNIRFVDENEKQTQPKENADKKQSDPDKE